MYIFKNEFNEQWEQEPCMFLYATIKLDSGKIDRHLSSKLGTEPFTEDEIKQVIENSEFLAWLRKTGDTPVILKTYQKPGTSWREVKSDKKELKESNEEDFILNFEPFEESLNEGRFSDLSSKLEDRQRELRNLKVKLQNAPTSQAKDDIEIAIDKCENDIANIQGELTEIRYLNGGTHLLDYEESLNEDKNDDDEFILNFEPFGESLNEDTWDTSKPPLELTDAQKAELATVFGDNFTKSLEEYKVKLYLKNTDWTFDKLKHCAEIASRLKQKMDNIIFNDERVKASIKKGYIKPESILSGSFIVMYGKLEFYISICYKYKIILDDDSYVSSCAGFDMSPDGSLGVYSKYPNPEEEYLQQGSKSILWDLHRCDPTPEEEKERSEAEYAIYSEPYETGRYNGD